ncbi:MAG: hypothetical protein UX02_C0001G0150 [Candidatus Moranbacteria bacterium GW2011_GWC1_45_18]|nr:MAG: hypothetical protein UT79_C0002G0247 [Candidatus Moranbacteria bacterium GW2011_GWC2_40_12]KKT32887.1 MAG: hypothetical protein UW19_C0014G0024 [Candidatus Moranbacteria bacterium GW2011_GWF2_44_10]KKU00702.1 MAG: hypothetical protein UX02_C0001G0150 [Candidatus Moranbacteria bacterium GW2011_GWC1_45_18]OGI24261.1 MAG: hypothetical protein A2194_04400 [Candidatus Moranbacteria bacterium RIFOXYA1_FULL_44_8]OGI36333.1 MAG: hypothetical protein A2407_01605 [Candidatus Moranbacteria bacteri
MNTVTKESVIAQEVQDKIFRRMPVEKKLEMLGDFYYLAKDLNRIGDKNGSADTSKKNHKNIRRS